jgi:putative transposase
MIGKPIQPVLTVVIDSATRLVVATALWEGMPNAEQALAAVAKAVHGRHVDGTFVGGVPGALRSDRGAELIGRTMTNGLIRLGVVADPTQSRAPFEKGIVERWIRTLKDEFVSSLPGWTGGPTNHAGTSVLAVPEADLLWFSDLEARLDSWVARYNTCRVHGTLGVTPIQAWRADTNAIGVADEQAVAHLALQAERSKRKTGIQLHNIDYIAVELRSVGKRVRVAYLPNEYGYVWVHAGAAGWAKAVPELSEDDHVRLLAARKAASAKVTVVHRHARELRAHDEQVSAVEGAARDLGLVEEPQTPVAALPKADQVEDVLARMARLLGDAS